MSRHKTIIVEGIIGAGKSCFASELGRALGEGTLVQLEPDEKKNANPYLALYYGNMDRWAYTMQTHLLTSRFGMHLYAQRHVMGGHGHAVIDRSYYGDTAFARLQYKEGHMSDLEYKTYTSIYHNMTSFVLLPNVCIRLLVRPEIAINRIIRRMEKETGRRCESVIDIGYLRALELEITHMIGVLRSQGVYILDMPWDVDRDDEESRKGPIEAVAARIIEQEVPDLFLDLHRRTI